LPGERLLIAVPGGRAEDLRAGVRMVESTAQKSSWLLTAAEFAQTHRLAAEHQARAVLMLGPGCASLGANGLRGLAETVLGAQVDLAVPRYALPPMAGLVNSALLYPLSRTLFAVPVRYPLAVDLGMSARMAERLAAAAQKLIAMNQGEAALWTVSEATAAGMTVEEVDAGPREQPQPAGADLQTNLPAVTGSLFRDVEAKAALWQRARVAAPARRMALARTNVHEAADTEPMVQAFRLGYTNLQEIWGMVLSPNSMLGLMRLSQSDGAAFRMSDGLWVRIVYDFVVAWRQRTINRNHLLGALVPLYLAWAASHIQLMNSGADAERHVEALAAAFEADKAYLVSRWRWPDRFNP
jgi:glucosylglycerate synthase